MDKRDWQSDTRNIFMTLGASNLTSKVRDAHDYSKEHEVEGFVVQIPFSDLVKEAEKRGYLVFPKDILQKWAEERSEILERQRTCTCGAHDKKDLTNT